MSSLDVEDDIRKAYDFAELDAPRFEDGRAWLGLLIGSSGSAACTLVLGMGESSTFSDLDAAGEEGAAAAARTLAIACVRTKCRELATVGRGTRLDVFMV